MINTSAKYLIGDRAPRVKKTIEIDPKTGEPINEYEIACPPGLGPVYSDTDSVYFVMEKRVNGEDEAVKCADDTVATINESFPNFMRTAFFCQPGFDDLIRANREIVALSGIFRAKKKYVMLGVNMEGKKLDVDDPKALKTQGSDIKISSTPEMVRRMLKDVTLMVLKGAPRHEIDDYILKFRRELINIDASDELNILQFASVNSVKTLDEYYTKWERIEKPGLGRVTMPAQVRAVINHNHFLEVMKITDTQPIRNGQKVKVLWLRENEYGFTNMGFSSETEELPKWFRDHFEVDLQSTEEKLIDHKLDLIFDPIGWTVPTVQSATVGKLMEF